MRNPMKIEIDVNLNPASALAQLWMAMGKEKG